MYYACQTVCGQNLYLPILIDMKQWRQVLLVIAIQRLPPSPFFAPD